MTICPNFSSATSSEEPSYIFLVKLNIVPIHVSTKNPVSYFITVLGKPKSIPLKIHIEISQLNIRIHNLQSYSSP